MSKSTPNKDLIGKGLRSLLQNMDAEYKNPAGRVQPAAIEKAVATNRVALSNIVVNPKNPRKDFDQKALQELANSIKLHDIIQPLTVSALSDGKYQLIAGERRFRAAKLAGLVDVPAYIRQVNDKELLELALLENLQRVDLNELFLSLLDSKYLTDNQNIALCSLKNQLNKYKRAGAFQDYIKKELEIIKKNGGKLPKYNKITF
jgi:ParB family chromosome partitioning protein